MNFASDTVAPAHPAMLEGLARANASEAPSYGDDVFTAEVEARLCDVFETDVSVYLTASGTAANALALACLCPATGAVICHEEAHIERDERGAPEFFTGGGKLQLLPGDDGKIDMTALDDALAARNPDFVHETPAAALSLTNLNECGGAYSPDELRARIAPAKAAGLAVHMDGARFANAVVGLGVSPAALSWRLGVDALTFGMTKNGALGCEAIVLFGEARARLGELRARAKRAGHMPPKMRFLAAQMLAGLENDLWLALAERANAAAADLAAALTSAPGVRLAHPRDGNEVFVEMDAALAAHLQQAGAQFYPWPGGRWRFVCSWMTPPEDVMGIRRALSAFAAQSGQTA